MDARGGEIPYLRQQHRGRKASHSLYNVQIGKML